MSMLVTGKWFRALFVALSTTGCATMVEGTSQSVTVSTEPPGANCTIDRVGTHLGTVNPTPGSVHIDKSKNDLTVACQKDGFTTATISSSPKFVGTTFGNLVLGGGVGAIVDAASGANYEYPTEIKLTLAPATAAATTPTAPQTASAAATTPPAPSAPSAPSAPQTASTGSTRAQ
jgi:hypothetical protein